MTAEPETVDALVAALGDYIEGLLKAARLAGECGFSDVEAMIRTDLERTQRDLLLVLCTVSDGDPRRRVAAMITKIEAALGTGAQP
jgi:hypothetical protein